jgi:hypothetical protein
VLPPCIFLAAVVVMIRHCDGEARMLCHCRLSRRILFSGNGKWPILRRKKRAGFYRPGWPTKLKDLWLKNNPTRFSWKKASLGAKSLLTFSGQTGRQIPRRISRGDRKRAKIHPSFSCCCNNNNINMHALLLYFDYYYHFHKRHLSFHIYSQSQLQPATAMTTTATA